VEFPPQRLPCHAQENLALAGFRMHLPDACLGETPDDFGKLERPPQLPAGGMCRRSSI
jgi:hypothetical protein